MSAQEFRDGGECPDCGAVLWECYCEDVPAGHVICSDSGNDAGECDSERPAVRITVEIEYADPSPDAAVAWLSDYVFSKIDGFVSAECGESEEDPNSEVEDDRINKVRGYFDVPRRRDALTTVARQVRELGFDWFWLCRPDDENATGIGWVESYEAVA